MNDQVDAEAVYLEERLRRQQGDPAAVPLHLLNAHANPWCCAACC